MGCDNLLQAPLQQGRAVQAQIQEHGYGDSYARRQHGTGCFCGSLQDAGGLAFVHVRLIEEKTDSGNDRGARGIEDPLEHVNSEHVRDGQLFFAGEKQRANGFAGATEQEDSGKAREGQLVDVPEVGRSQISLEDLPAQGTQRVACVNGDDRESQQREIGVAYGVEEFCAAEITEMEEGEGAIKNKANDAEPNHHNKKLPRRSAHEPASVLSEFPSVKFVQR